MSSITRRAWHVLAVVCASIGAVNAFLPILPTTIFWFIAAWAFGKSSPSWPAGCARIRVSVRG